MVQLSYPYKTTGKTMALTIWMDLCWQSDVSAFNMLSRFLIALRPKRSIFSFHLLQWFLSPRKKWLISKISADCLLKSGLIERVIQRVRQTVTSALAEEGSVRRCLKRAVQALDSRLPARPSRGDAHLADLELTLSTSEALCPPAGRHHAPPSAPLLRPACGLCPDT